MRTNTSISKKLRNFWNYTICCLVKVRNVLYIIREVGGWAGIKNGDWGRVVMVKTVIICLRLSVWAQ